MATGSSSSSNNNDDPNAAADERILLGKKKKTTKKAVGDSAASASASAGEKKKKKKKSSDETSSDKKKKKSSKSNKQPEESIDKTVTISPATTASTTATTNSSNSRPKLKAKDETKPPSAAAARSPASPHNNNKKKSSKKKTRSNDDGDNDDLHITDDDNMKQEVESLRPSLLETKNKTSFANRILTNLGMFKSFRADEGSKLKDQPQEERNLLDAVNEESEVLSKEHTVPSGAPEETFSPKQTVAKLKTFSKMLGILNSNKDFLAAFDDDSDDDAQERSTKRGSRTSVNNLLAELQTYEESLAKEREAIEKERGEIAVERESLNNMLEYSMARNQDLQAEISGLKHQVDEQAFRLTEKAEDNSKGMLLAEIDVLKKNLERKDTTIASLHVEKAKQKAGESDRGSHATVSTLRSSSVPKSDDESTSSTTDGGNDNLTDSPATARASMLAGAKMNGEILKLQGSLKEQQTLVEQKNKQILDLKQEMEELGKNEGIKKLKDYIQALEQEKSYFATELAKMKKAATTNNDATAPESPTKTGTASPKEEKNGFFGWGWGNKNNGATQSTASNPSEADLIEIGSFASPISPNRKKLQFQSSPSARLNSIMDGM